MTAPQNISLIQMHEGIVSIDTHHASIDSSATHLRIYLKTLSGVSWNLHATVRLDSAGGLFFEVPKGWFGHAAITAFNMSSPTPVESIQSDPILLQMYERVIPGFNIAHFFHDKKNTRPSWVEKFDRTWQYAIGYRETDNAVFVFKSNDYFTTWQVVNYWPEGEIDQGGMLVFYIDQFGYMYVSNRPGALISDDGGLTWTQLPFYFVTNQSALQPFWNIAEDERSELIIFSEYGLSANGPHHRLWKSKRWQRDDWYSDDHLDTLGNFRHIHGYHINPYIPDIHLLFLGEPPTNLPNTQTPGFYVNQNAGDENSWSSEILNRPYPNYYNFNGDGIFRNGPCCVTWWPSGKAFIANDSGRRGIGAWYGNGPFNWGALNLNPIINLLTLDEFSTWTATPWDAKAVEGGYETYCASNHDNPAYDGDTSDASVSCNNPSIPGGQIGYTAPSLLWRFNADPFLANHDLDGSSGSKTIIAKLYWPAVPFLYISAARGNIFPADADFIFCNALGGIRIPRKEKTYPHHANNPSPLPQ